MKDYVKPTLKFKPDVIVLHCGTNYLKKCDNNQELAKNIVTLATDIAEEETSVAISGLHPRNDKFKVQAEEVNKILQQMCSARNIRYIDNTNIDPKHHLNRSRLHPNKKGSAILTRNLHQFLKN